ncbi:hypothetical protein IU494_30285 [Nocardia terpenica]|uniref:hypothetical protein n=1 Tax=Nocardia terpenica TaxID=455432 RepID=UPI0018946137|nr:hypothetical protein [Nocardia terpenica]MBF6064937.1 hypothetical protein [Nocardia terpenica]MBF6115209.1 hypothetical protein [Nocardia terpenica]MBF6122531.1 hypothetical protein [Nocardia terpenica]
MSFPLRSIVGHHHYRDGGRDAHGNPTEYFEPALDAAGEPVRVYGWAPVSSTEPALPGHTRVVTEVDLYTAPGFVPGPHDLIDLPAAPAGRFEIVGFPADYGHGPFDWSPGSVIRLKKVDG